jgi:3-(methylthio)propanoyl-CoA dehydrogenase
MARQALAATRKLAAGSAQTDFLQAKLVTAHFYCEQVLPQASGLVPAITAGAGDLLALSPAQF